jgi:hypothetical protein
MGDNSLIQSEHCNNEMPRSDPLTTISVRTSTLRALQYYKLGGSTWDDVFARFIEEHPPEAFLKEMARRAKEEREHPIEELFRKAGLE